MEAVRGYLLSVICAAVLGSVLASILPGKSGIAGLVRFAAGVYLTVTILQPILRFDFSSLEDFLQVTAADYAAPSAEGERLADAAMEERIRSSTTSYILDKVISFGAQADVQVELTGDDIPVPRAVIISGNIPADIRSQLEVFLATELGIERENQQWISEK